MDFRLKKLKQSKNLKFKILSKFHSQKGRIFFEEKDISFWEEEFQKSLINLNTKKLDTFFVHDTNDLSKKGNIFLTDWLKILKTSKFSNYKITSPKSNCE